MKVCMDSGQMHRYVCDSRCMIEFYKQPNWRIDMANEYGIDHGTNHIERCFDAFVVSEVEREIQYHKGKIKYSAECLEKLEQQLKKKRLEGASHEEK